MVCVQRHNQLRFMPWEVDITTHENAEITNWIHPGFTVSSLDQPGWTWNKSSTRLRLIYFPGTIPSSVNMLLELIWRLSLQQRESEVTWSCPTLCNPVDCSPLGSSVHGILQARILGCHFFSIVLYGNTGRKLRLPRLGQMSWDLGRQPGALWAKVPNGSRTDNGRNKVLGGNVGKGRTRPNACGTADFSTCFC